MDAAVVSKCVYTVPRRHVPDIYFTLIYATCELTWLACVSIVTLVIHRFLFYLFFSCACIKFVKILNIYTSFCHKRTSKRVHGPAVWWKCNRGSIAIHLKRCYRLFRLLVHFKQCIEQLQKTYTRKAEHKTEERRLILITVNEPFLAVEILFVKKLNWHEKYYHWFIIIFHSHVLSLSGDNWS